MSDNLIRCVHENGKVCFLTKAATENRNFMKKYGIRVEHVEKKDSAKQVAESLAEATKPAKPKATRTRAAKSKKPTKV